MLFNIRAFLFFLFSKSCGFNIFIYQYTKVLHAHKKVLGTMLIPMCAFPIECESVLLVEFSCK